MSIAPGSNTHTQALSGAACLCNNQPTCSQLGPLILRFITSSLMCLLPLLGGGAEIPQAVLPAGVGVNIHFVTGHEKDLGLIAKAGFKFVRMDFGWSAIEKRKGEYDWSGYEELVANLEKRGLRAIFILDYSHLLYEETVTSPNPITGEG